MTTVAESYRGSWPDARELVQRELAAYLAAAADPANIDLPTRCSPWTVNGVRFVGSSADPQGIMPHQLGPIPVALQMLSGLNELAIHHDDIATAAGSRYRPDTDVLKALNPVWQQALGGLPGADEPWTNILIASGRTRP